VSDRFRLEHLRRRVEANPASIAFAGLAEEYRRAGMVDEAIATCRAGLRRHPVYVAARVTLGTALIEAGQLDEAALELETVLRAAPGNAAAIRGLAHIQGLKSGEIMPVTAARRLEQRQLEALDGFLAAINHVRSGPRLAG
jgi:Flp pilus assembly protein TadD